MVTRSDSIRFLSVRSVSSMLHLYQELNMLNVIEHRQFIALDIVTMYA